MLVGIRRRGAAEARSAWVTLGFGKVSGAALLFGFLLLAGETHSDVFAVWALVPRGALHDIAFALMVVGFGAKVGLVPLQVWLPIGYPAAPGPTRAAMAGLAVNVGFYGLWRFLGVLGRPPVWLAVAVLIVGGITALVGIVFAAVQSRLNRVIAYSSVENAGIILVGYGVALAGAASHRPAVMAVGLLAASLQVLAHAVAKSSLFASSAFFESDFGTDELEDAARRRSPLPVSGAAFGLGSLTLAGLPPTIGFVSEWFLLEALLQEFRIHNLALRLAMALAGALVALTVGVALSCFIRLIGFVVLGRPSRHRPGRGSGRRWRGGAGRARVMGVSCLALAAAAPWVIRFIADGIASVVPAGVVTGRSGRPGCSSRCSPTSRSSPPPGSSWSCPSGSSRWSWPPWRSRGEGCCGPVGCRRGGRRPRASPAPTATPRSATPTSSATSWPTCSAPAARPRPPTWRRRCTGR